MTLTSGSTDLKPNFELGLLTEGSVNNFLGAMYEMGRSENSVRAYRADLMGLIHWTQSQNSLPNLTQIPMTSIEGIAAQYLTAHRETLAPRTIQRKLAAFKAWARYNGHRSFLEGYKTPTPAKAEPHPLPEGIEGVLAMYGYAYTPHHRALVVLCGIMGLRIGEALRVQVDHFNLPEQSLLVHGKGSKQRVIYYDLKTWALIQGPLIVASQEYGPKALLVPLSDRGARVYYTRLAKRALKRESSTHDMRATAATAMYEKTKDIRAVQENLGHANSKTTEIYTGVSKAARREAASVI